MRLRWKPLSCLRLCKSRLVGGTKCSACPFVHSSVAVCERDVLKTIEPILMQTGTGQRPKRSTVQVVREAGARNGQLLGSGDQKLRDHYALCVGGSMLVINVLDPKPCLAYRKVLKTPRWAGI